MDIIYWALAGKQPTAANVTRNELEAHDTLEAILEEYARLVGGPKAVIGKKFKVGITSDPQKRSYGHGYLTVDQWDVGDFRYTKQRRGAWACMHVIYQTNSTAKIRVVEDDLIQDAQIWGGIDDSENRASGGGGNLCPHGPYYIYLLQERA